MLEDTEKGFVYIPVSRELVRDLARGEWSRPVQVKLENGQFIFRDLVPVEDLDPLLLTSGSYWREADLSW